MELVLEIIRNICEAIIRNPAKSLGFAGILFAAAVRGCLETGKGPTSDTTPPPPPPPQMIVPQNDGITVNIDPETLQKLLETINAQYQYCRNPQQKQQQCGRNLPNQELFKETDALSTIPIKQLQEEFDRESLLAMYRSDIILQASPNRWEYLKVKNYLPEIDRFVSRYKSRFNELKQAYGNAEEPNIKWALSVIPIYDDNLRPGLEAKVRRMQ